MTSTRRAEGRRRRTSETSICTDRIYRVPASWFESNTWTSSSSSITLTGRPGHWGSPAQCPVWPHAWQTLRAFRLSNFACKSVPLRCWDCGQARWVLPTTWAGLSSLCRWSRALLGTMIVEFCPCRQEDHGNVGFGLRLLSGLLGRWQGLQAVQQVSGMLFPWNRSIIFTIVPAGGQHLEFISYVGVMGFHARE